MGGWNELKAIKSSNKCIIDTKQFTFNVVYGAYTVCDILNKKNCWKTNERDKLFAKQLKTAHNALHVKFTNRLYRVIVRQSLYFPKLNKQKQ